MEDIDCCGLKTEFQSLNLAGYALSRLNYETETLASEARVLDEPDSAKPAQLIIHTGPPGYIGWTRFQPM